ncbi:biotin transporter BioY [Pseudoflavonifractor sp. An184]|uniref:biotin transporter BioY n=1 Tax=Pseudoflavonifractor sp. An184 TaxID=1965576 RepID=UPI000B38025A|nr:biotin transporter BioY [Pseudoflavonifractor sp. An184]MBS5548786.1 biotin transporter BioY [Oscillospiraceae bacterium]OUP52734.1 biotin transporter BioY [Pseudoflavonifractor sp. An184]
MNQEVTHAARRGKTYRMAMTALMAAVTCVLAPMAIPIGPVPISFTNLAIYLSLYLLGWKRGTVSYLVYVLIGAVGVPVFSGFTGGLGKLAGATGGYIVGFIPMAVIAGLVIDQYRNRGLQLAGMIVGTAVCYAFGTAWFCFVMDSTPMAALSLCVIPFIPGDLVKMLLAMWVGPMIRRRLVQAGLYPERM